MHLAWLWRVAWLVCVALVPTALDLAGSVDICHRPGYDYLLPCLLAIGLVAGIIFVWALASGVVAGYWSGGDGALAWSIASLLALLAGWAPLVATRPDVPDYMQVGVINHFLIHLLVVSVVAWPFAFFIGRRIRIARRTPAPRGPSRW